MKLDCLIVIFMTKMIFIILKNVVATIKQRVYDPINQLMGYIKTADPIYIPRDNHAREQIRLIEMDDILEFLLYFFIQES